MAPTHRAIAERKPRALLRAEFTTGFFWGTGLTVVLLSRGSRASRVPLQAGHPPEPRSPRGHGEPGQASPLPRTEQRGRSVVQAVRIWDGRQRFPSSPCMACLWYVNLSAHVWVSSPSFSIFLKLGLPLLIWLFFRSAWAGSTGSGSVDFSGLFRSPPGWTLLAGGCS